MPRKNSKVTVEDLKEAWGASEVNSLATENELDPQVLASL